MACPPPPAPPSGRGTRTDPIDVTGRHVCTICLNDVCGDQAWMYPESCGHVFHEHCLGRALEVALLCPVCRQRVSVLWRPSGYVDVDDLFDFSEDPEEDDVSDEDDDDNRCVVHGGVVEVEHARHCLVCNTQYCVFCEVDEDKCPLCAGL